MTINKVKIKRRQRKIFKPTAKEKLLAGIGLGSALFSGGQIVGANKPQTQTVSSRVKNDGFTGKAKSFLHDFFRVKTAHAADSSVALATREQAYQQAANLRNEKNRQLNDWYWPARDEVYNTISGETERQAQLNQLQNIYNQEVDAIQQEYENAVQAADSVYVMAVGEVQAQARNAAEAAQTRAVSAQASVSAPPFIFSVDDNFGRSLDLQGKLPPAIITDGAYFVLQNNQYQQTATDSNLRNMLGVGGGIAAGTVIISRLTGNSLGVGKIVGLIGKVFGTASKATTVGITAAETGMKVITVTTSTGAVLTPELAQTIAADPVLAQTFGLAGGQTVTTSTGAQMTLEQAAIFSRDQVLGQTYGLNQSFGPVQITEINTPENLITPHEVQYTGVPGESMPYEAAGVAVPGSATWQASLAQGPTATAIAPQVPYAGGVAESTITYQLDPSTIPQGMLRTPNGQLITPQQLQEALNDNPGLMHDYGIDQPGAKVITNTGAELAPDQALQYAQNSAMGSTYGLGAGGITAAVGTGAAVGTAAVLGGVASSLATEVPLHLASTVLINRAAMTPIELIAHQAGIEAVRQSTAQGLIQTGTQTAAQGGLTGALGGTLKAVSQVLNKVALSVAKFFGFSSAIPGVIIISAAISGAMIGIGHWRAVARNNRLKAADTRAIEAVMPSILKIVDIYNSNGGRTLEEEIMLHDAAVKNITELFNEAAAKFQRNKSLISQKQYVEGFIASMNATYAQRRDNILHSLNSMNVFLQPDGTRIVGTGMWGEIRIAKDGTLLRIENTNAEIPPPASVLATIIAKDVTIAVPQSNTPVQAAPSVVPVHYDVYQTAAGKMVYVAGYGLLTITNSGALNESNEIVNLPTGVLREIENSGVITDMTTPEPVAAPPQTTPIVYDVFLTDEGKVAWVSGYDLIIIAPDGVYKADAAGQKILSQKINNFSQDLVNAISAPGNNITDLRAAPPPAPAHPPAPPPVAFVTSLVFNNKSIGSILINNNDTAHTVRVGQQWEIQINGPAGAEVAAIGGRKSGTVFARNTMSMGSIGSNGRLVLNGTFTSSDKGEWKIDFKADGQSAGVIHFEVQDASLGSMSIATGALVNATVGQVYNQTLAKAGGTGSAAWSLDSTSGLPSGLALSASGVISGTPAPNTAGSYNLIFTVRDSEGKEAAKTLTLTVLSQAAGGTASQTVPILQQITPLAAAVNQDITIIGSNFNSQVMQNLVMFNNIGVTPTSLSGNRLTVRVPQYLTPGAYKIRVVNFANPSRESNELFISVTQAPVDSSYTPPPQEAPAPQAPPGPQILPAPLIDNSFGIPPDSRTYVFSKIKNSAGYSSFKQWANGTEGKPYYVISGKNSATGLAFRYQITKQQAKNIIARVESGL